MLLHGFRSVADRQAKNKEIMDTLNQAIENERLARDANSRAVSGRDVGFLPMDQVINAPRPIVKPKEFFTENDLIEEYSRRLQPYMINLSQVNNLLASLKNQDLIFQFNQDFPMFERMLEGQSTLNAERLFKMYLNFKREPTAPLTAEEIGEAVASKLPQLNQIIEELKQSRASAEDQRSVITQLLRDSYLRGQKKANQLLDEIRKSNLTQEQTKYYTGLIADLVKSQIPKKGELLQTINSVNELQLPQDEKNDILRQNIIELIKSGDTAGFDITSEIRKSNLSSSQQTELIKFVNDYMARMGVRPQEEKDYEPPRGRPSAPSAPSTPSAPSIPSTPSTPSTPSVPFGQASMLPAFLVGQTQTTLEPTWTMPAVTPPFQLPGVQPQRQVPPVPVFQPAPEATSSLSIPSRAITVNYTYSNQPRTITFTGDESEEMLRGTDRAALVEYARSLGLPRSGTIPQLASRIFNLLIQRREIIAPASPIASSLIASAPSTPLSSAAEEKAPSIPSFFRGQAPSVSTMSEQQRQSALEQGRRILSQIQTTTTPTSSETGLRPSVAAPSVSTQSGIRLRQPVEDIEVKWTEGSTTSRQGPRPKSKVFRGTETEAQLEREPTGFLRGIAERLGIDNMFVEQALSAQDSPKLSLARLILNEVNRRRSRQTGGNGIKRQLTQVSKNNPLIMRRN